MEEQACQIKILFLDIEKMGKHWEICGLEFWTWLLKNISSPSHSLTQRFCCKYRCKVGSDFFINYFMIYDSDYINCFMSGLLAIVCFMWSRNDRFFKVP